MKGNLYTHDGITLSVRAWSKRTRIPYSTLKRWLSAGKSIDEALKHEKVSAVSALSAWLRSPDPRNQMHQRG